MSDMARAPCTRRWTRRWQTRPACGLQPGPARQPRRTAPSPARAPDSARPPTAHRARRGATRQEVRRGSRKACTHWPSSQRLPSRQRPHSGRKELPPARRGPTRREKEEAHHTPPAPPSTVPRPTLHGAGKEEGAPHSAAPSTAPHPTRATLASVVAPTGPPARSGANWKTKKQVRHTLLCSAQRPDTHGAPHTPPAPPGTAPRLTRGTPEAEGPPTDPPARCGTTRKEKKKVRHTPPRSAPRPTTHSVAQLLHGLNGWIHGW